MDAARLKSELAAVEKQIEDLQDRRAALLLQLQEAEEPSGEESDDTDDGEAQLVEDEADEELLVAAEPLADYSRLSLTAEEQAVLAEAGAVASRVFSVSPLREPQVHALRALLCRDQDVLLVAPTGAGKSLTFQLPAVMRSGLTLVVSPLLSLMADQVLALDKAGVAAVSLSSTDAPESLKEGLARLDQLLVDAKAKSSTSKNLSHSAAPGSAASKNLRLLYVTPERVHSSKRLLAKLALLHEQGLIARIVVDEAHCVSVWGLDFRQSYLQLNRLRQILPGVPLLALTATASAPVAADIKRLLGFRSSSLVIRAPTHRPSLRYLVQRRWSEKTNDNQGLAEQIAAWIRAHWPSQTGIVYALSRKDVEELSAALSSLDITAAPYHAWMDARDRDHVQQQWLQGAVRVVVATVAFGLGINKPNVRFVVHATLAKSLDAYYQESGRAGRDGAPADCLLLWQASDLARVSAMVCTVQGGLQSLYAMTRYAINEKRCRRQYLAQHFNEPLPANACSGAVACDICNREEDSPAAAPSAAAATAAVGSLPTKAKTVSNQNAGTSSSRHSQSRVDVTADVRELVRLVQLMAAEKQSGTLKTVVKCWRGAGRKKLSATAQQIGKCRRDLPDSALEFIVVQLVVDGVLAQKIHHTAFQSLSYIVLGSNGRRFLDQSQGASNLVTVADWQLGGPPLPLTKSSRPSVKAAKRAKMDLTGINSNDEGVREQEVVVVDDDVDDFED